MSFPSCAICAVTLNQQHEQNVFHQNQCHNVPLHYSKSAVKTCTVVENGRVIVKPIQPPENETSSDI